MRARTVLWVNGMAIEGSHRAQRAQPDNSGPMQVSKVNPTGVTHVLQGHTKIRRVNRVVKRVVQASTGTLLLPRLLLKQVRARPVLWANGMAIQGSHRAQRAPLDNLETLPAKKLKLRDATSVAPVHTKTKPRKQAVKHARQDSTETQGLQRLRLKPLHANTAELANIPTRQVKPNAKETHV